MKVGFYNLGCKVNAYETEFLINEFKKKGYEIVDFNDKADIYIIFYINKKYHLKV